MERTEKLIKQHPLLGVIILALIIIELVKLISLDFD